MAFHASSPLNSLRFPSAAKSRSIQVHIDAVGTPMYNFGMGRSCLWRVLKGCGWWSFIHHDGERKGDLQNKGHKEKIDYKKAN
ncbi:hypothetical protein Tco_0434613 [Tanacetum coccineum]